MRHVEYFVTAGLIQSFVSICSIRERFFHSPEGRVFVFFGFFFLNNPIITEVSKASETFINATFKDSIMNNVTSLSQD